MDFSFLPMSESLAGQILAWHYPAPYDVYNPTGGAAGLAELMNGEYYAAVGDSGQLVGFCCFGPAARVPAGEVAGCYQQLALDVGLGLRPDLTGRGLGACFLAAVLQFAGTLDHVNLLRLTVLQFNQRAIRVYLRSGFAVSDQFDLVRADGARSFLVMTKRPASPTQEKTFAS